MITLLGPTASGKTAIAVRLAYHLEGEIISADSRQVYKGMDIGTGKDLSEYQVEGTSVPYHLIDILPAGEQYSLYAYQRDFYRVYRELRSRGVEHPILCGGTGLYAEAILRGYQLPDVPANPELRSALSKLSPESLAEKLRSYGPLHNTTDLDTTQRTIRAIEIADYAARYPEQVSTLQTEYPPIDSLIVCLDLPREERRRRISSRLERRLQDGMVAEVEQLLASGISPQAMMYYGLEYKFVTQYIVGDLSYSAMLSQLEVAIHQFAKRQMTWFRGMERRGFTVHYIDALLSPMEQVEQILLLYADYTHADVPDSTL